MSTKNVLASTESMLTSNDSILDSAKKELDKLPPESFQLGVVGDQQRGVGVEEEANKTLGKGWSLAEDASWYQRAGWKVAGWIGWTGGSK